MGRPSSSSFTVDQIKSLLFGVALGDALGVPVEFMSREEIREDPVTDMRGYGTYNLPAGTFSDDSSLTFCLAEALLSEFDLTTIGNTFVKWYHYNYWTARGSVFDIGHTTRVAIDRLAEGVKPSLAGCYDASDNGNGALMRIAPLVFYVFDKPLSERFALARQVSAMTHGHLRSVIACFYYLEFAKQLLEKKNKFDIYQNLQGLVTDHLEELCIDKVELGLFDRLLKQNVFEVQEEDISSTGYVLHTLEASIWTLLSTNDYEAAVLKAVNLGDDTDTTGSVTGALAGLLYGVEEMPSNWLAQIARREDIENLAIRLSGRFSSH
jgi:ADP-ribosyl-[dinitrogen reductase] hydrolase